MIDLSRPWLLGLLLPLAWAGVLLLRAGAWTLPRHLPAPVTDGSPHERRKRGGPPLSLVLRLGALALLVVALAGPRLARPLPPPPGQGLALMVALDVSGSMETVEEGLSTRLDLGREEVARFVRQRPRDRIGLVTFAGEARTEVPPTVHHSHLRSVLETVSPREDREGTAMGSGLGLAAHGLLAVPSPSRVVLLVTDGRSNAGTLDPLPVARAARELGMRIHTVGVGREGGGEPLDAALLGDVARVGGGTYFRARDAGGLRRAMVAIDSLETGPVEGESGVRHRSLHLPLLLGVVLLLVGEGGAAVLPRGRIA